MVLSHVQRAEKLFKLFPGETDDFFDFILYFCELFEKTPRQITRKYFNGVTPEYMEAFIKPVATAINTNRSQLLQDPTLCARELFGDYRHIFTRVCLERYMHVLEISMELNAAVLILFGIESPCLQQYPGDKYTRNILLNKLIKVIAIHLAPGQTKSLLRLNNNQRSAFRFDHIHAGTKPMHIVLFQSKVHLLYVGSETNHKAVSCVRIPLHAKYTLVDYLFNQV